MSFNDCIEKYNLKNEATSNFKKNQQVLLFLSLNDVGIYSTDGPFLVI